MRQIMINGATALKEVDVYCRNGDSIHVSIEPNAAGGIVDARGDGLSTRREGLMARLDEKGSQQITLSRNTLWLLGAGVVLLNLAFSYGGSVLGWTRQDEQIRTKVETTAKAVDELNSKVDKLSETIQVQQIRDARTEGYKLGATDSHNAKEQKK